MPSLIWVNQFALLPGDGGGTRHFELSRELVKRGWQVTLLASDLHLHALQYTRRSAANDRETKVERVDGVDIRWLWAARYERNNWRRLLNWVTFHRSVLRETRTMRQGADVVIGSSPQIFAASASRALARRLGATFVLEVRDLWPESLLAVGGSRGPAYLLLDRVAKGLYRDATRVIVLARGVRDYLASRGIAASKLVHVPNGVDVESIRPSDGVRDGQQSRPLTLIYAGAHGPANGLDRLLDAAEILSGARNIRFLLVGGGPSKPQLCQDARERGLSNVTFLDPVPKQELAKLLNSADAGLMLLKDAPLFAFGVSPNKLFDYLAAGLPVVCNVPGEVAEMLADAGAGIQAADSSAAALARSIEAFAALGSEEIQRKAQAGRRWVEREHSRGVLADRLDAALRELLA